MSLHPRASSNPGAEFGIEGFAIGEICPKLSDRLAFVFLVGRLSWKRWEGLGDVVLGGDVIGRCIYSPSWAQLMLRRQYGASPLPH